MSKIKIDPINRYKIIGIGVILSIMGICQFFYSKGKFIPIPVPNEFWALLTMMMTNVVISLLKVSHTKNAVMIHVVGSSTILILGYVGASIIFKLPVGKEMWSLLGTMVGFLFTPEKVVEN